MAASTQVIDEVGRLTGDSRESAGPMGPIVNALEEDIVFGRLHQRERLIEDDLMARFGAKRHVIRQALAELERMGLVQRVPNRGSSVRAFSPETVHQLYGMRELLETHAIRSIPFPIAPADLARLKQIQALHDRAVKELDLSLAFRSNIEFHRMLFSFCQNPVLAGAIDEYAKRTHGIRFYLFTDPVHLRRARDEHHKMIRALKTGARAELAELCRQHLVPSKQFYLQVSLEHPLA